MQSTISGKITDGADPKSGPKGLAKAANTTCDRKILDTCVTTLMVFGRRGVYLPKDHAEMIPHCQEEFEAEDCVRNFARRCLPPFERQLSGMLILGAGQVLRKRCAPDGTKEYLSHYKCIKDSIEHLHDAMDQLIYTLMETSEQANNDLKIPSACCSFARFEANAGRIIRAECGKYDPSAIDYISTKMIKGYVSDLLDLSCQGYNDQGDKCAKANLPTGGFIWSSTNNTLIRNANSKLPASKPNSVVLPFLKVFTSL